MSHRLRRWAGAENVVGQLRSNIINLLIILSNVLGGRRPSALMPATTAGACHIVMACVRTCVCAHMRAGGRAGWRASAWSCTCSCMRWAGRLASHRRSKSCSERAAHDPAHVYTHVETCVYKHIHTLVYMHGCTNVYTGIHFQVCALVCIKDRNWKSLAVLGTASFQTL